MTYYEDESIYLLDRVAACRSQLSSDTVYFNSKCVVDVVDDVPCARRGQAGCCGLNSARFEISKFDIDLDSVCPCEVCQQLLLRQSIGTCFRLT